MRKSFGILMLFFLVACLASGKNPECPFKSDAEVSEAEIKLKLFFENYFNDKRNFGKKIIGPDCGISYAIADMTYLGSSKMSDEKMGIAILEKGGQKRAVVWLRNKGEVILLPKCKLNNVLENNQTITGESFTFDKLESLDYMVVVYCPDPLWLK